MEGSQLLLCRLCRKHRDYSINIFDIDGSHGLPIWKIIEELLQLEISPNDGLPLAICSHCFSKLAEFKSFKAMCIDSREELLKIVTKNVDRTSDCVTSVHRPQIPRRWTLDVPRESDPLSDGTDVKLSVTDLNDDEEVPGLKRELVEEDSNESQCEDSALSPEAVAGLESDSSRMTQAVSRVSAWSVDSRGIPCPESPRRGLLDARDDEKDPLECGEDEKPSISELREPREDGASVLAPVDGASICPSHPSSGSADVDDDMSHSVDGELSRQSAKDECVSPAYEECSQHSGSDEVLVGSRTDSRVPAMKFSKSQKGNQVLTYLGFEYLSSRTINGVLAWRCRQSRSMKCHSIVKTKDGAIVQQPTEHCHDSCPQKAEANVARSRMKQDMRTVSANPRNVMGNVLSKLSNDVLAHIPKQSSVARNLLNHRKDGPLSNPTTVNFDIPEKYCQLVLHDSGVGDPDRILVLGDRELALKLNKDTIYGDGTFDEVPSMLFQLYTWHAKVGKVYPPCIYVLLREKNAVTFARMFGIMKLLVPNLIPRKVFVDFEEGCMGAARVAFPGADVKGCYFHLCQSLIRTLGDVGLRTEFETDINVKLKLKSLAALTFVPVRDVRSVFDQLAGTFPDVYSYNEVLRCFFSTYIEGAGGGEPPFPITVWNHHGAALERSPRTTNLWERFHNLLNSLFHCSHPSVWFLFDGLQRDVARHRLTLDRAFSGQLEGKRRRGDTLHDLVANSVQRYEQVEDKLKYLRALANLQ